MRSVALIVILQIQLDDGGGKHQSRKSNYRVRAKILVVAGALATKVEVIVEDVTTVVQVETNRDSDGTAVDQGQVATLELVVGPLMLGDETFDTLADHALRVGETVPVRGPDLEHELYGAPPVGATSTLSLLHATAELATYQLDYAAKGTEPNLIGDIEIKGRRTIVVDRVRGQIVDDQLVTFKTERRKGREAGTAVEESTRVTF